MSNWSKDLREWNRQITSMTDTLIMNVENKIQETRIQFGFRYSSYYWLSSTGYIGFFSVNRNIVSKTRHVADEISPPGKIKHPGI